MRNRGSPILDLEFVKRVVRSKLPRSGIRHPKWAVLFFLLLLVTSPLRPQSPTIVEIDLDDIVHPISADYVRQGLEYAKKENARAVILRINTPGGLMDSMRDMVEAILTSPVPVITWVGPNGARAASAGFFVLLAGDVAEVSIEGIGVLRNPVQAAQS